MVPTLKSTCLRPSYSLRRQLVLSYGSTAFVTTTIVVILGVWFTLRAGNDVKETLQTRVAHQTLASSRNKTIYVAQLIEQQIKNNLGSASLLKDFVTDRIVGYPDQGFEDDRYVPFWDTVTNTWKYPLHSPLLPLDWQLPLSHDMKDFAEGFQERTEAFLPLFDYVSMASATYFFAGNCNVSETNPNGRTYYPNCTAENNNVKTGGVVRPVETTGWLASKAADIATFMKPLFEALPDAWKISVSFLNSGAGSEVAVPGYIKNSQDTYISIGCDWMKETNPYTGKSYATETERKWCTREGEDVTMRNYNPMERAFCRDQALHPGERIYGPEKSISNGTWVLTFGRGIFDAL